MFITGRCRDYLAPRGRNGDDIGEILMISIFKISFPKIVRTVKSKRLRWTGEMRYRIQ
jgi:hypothetical protein